MRRSCYCCMSGTYIPKRGYPRPNTRPYPNPFPPYGDPFGECERCGHPESSHRKDWY